MKTKYFLIYVFVGVAFCVISLWVLLSRGKNPKAINAKYKLGGIMLIAWSVIATASCEKGPLSNLKGSIDNGQIMCYDPIVSNYIGYYTDKRDDEGRYYLTHGGKLTITIDSPTYREYSFSINKKIADKNGEEATGELLQAGSFELKGGSDPYKYVIEYSPTDKDYAGQAVIMVWGPSEENQTGELLYWQSNLFITNDDEN